MTAQTWAGDFPGQAEPTAFLSKVNSQKNHAPLKKEGGELVEHLIISSFFFKGF